MNFKLILVFVITLSMYEKADAKPSSNASDRDLDLAALEKLGMGVLDELGLKLEDVLEHIPFTWEQIEEFLVEHDVLSHVEEFITTHGLAEMTPEEIVGAVCDPANAEIVDEVLGYVTQLPIELPADFELPAINIC